MQLPARRFRPLLRRCDPARVRGAFTLIEMLVVICIIAIVAAIAIGSIFGTISHNRLLATEHLIADGVRQARHTARSTGQPAVLTITPVLDDSGTTVGGRIAGTSRTCIWSETFDEAYLPVLGAHDDGATLPAIQETGDAVGPAMVVGRTGKGVLVSAFAPGTTALNSGVPGRLVTQPLDKSAQVVRGARTDGFYLTCSVKPPSARTAGPITIPLLMISDTPPVPGAPLDPRAEDSQCGICLMNTINPFSAGIDQYSWQVDGWVSGAAGHPVHLHSFDPAPASDLPDPIAGGAWIEVGLLYTNAGGGASGHMSLFVDGRPVAEMPLVSTPAAIVPLTLLSSGTTVYVGHATFDPADPDQRSAAPIDDACLYRVGAGQVGDLPGGVVPTGNTQQGAQIVALPDGRVQVTRQGAQNDGTAGNALTFEELRAPQQTHVEIAIDARGVVTSTYVVPGAPR